LIGWHLSMLYVMAHLAASAVRVGKSYPFDCPAACLSSVAW